MSDIELARVIEAILFVAEEPVSREQLAEVLEIGVDDVDRSMGTLRASLDERGSGLVVRETAGGWRLYTRPETRPFLESFAVSASSARLSNAAMEVLSIIAYQQPVSKGQITEIRGVDSGSAVRTLERRGLIQERERLSTPGNPALYETSRLFLEKVGINSLDELPPLADHVPPSTVVESLEESFRSE
ncbi:MAG: SMC-Scp complex subunit ScpB [Acidimicrobiia bacterium]